MGKLVHKYLILGLLLLILPLASPGVIGFAAVNCSSFYDFEVEDGSQTWNNANCTANNTGALIYQANARVETGGKYGNALYLDGTGDHANSSLNVGITGDNASTTGMWLKFNGSGGSEIIYSWGLHTNQQKRQLQENGAAGFVYTLFDSEETFVSKVANYSNWAFLVVVQNATHGREFFNGVLINEWATPNAPPKTAHGVLRIGDDPGGGGPWFSGWIDNFFNFAEEWSPDEVADAYANSTLCLFRGGGANCTSAPSVQNNLSITMNSTLGVSILTFNATVTSSQDSHFFSTTDGKLETNLTSNATVTFNITVNAHQYFSETHTGYNGSDSTFNETLVPYANVTASDLWDSSAITFNITIYNTTHSQTWNGVTHARPAFQGSHSANLSAANYLDRTGLSVNLDAGATTNFTMWQAELTVAVREWLSNKSIDNFNLTTFDGTITQTNTTTVGNITLYLKAGNYNLTAITTLYYSNLTVNAIAARTITNTTLELKSSFINITAQQFNGTIITSFNITITSLDYTYSATVGTSTGIIQTYLINGSWNFSIDPTNFLANYTSFEVTGYNHSYNFEVWATNTVNITVLHEINLTRMNFVNITMDFVNDDNSYRFNTSTGNLFQELLSPDTYTLRYSAPAYGERFYEFTLTNRTYNEFTLYMLETSDISNVTLTVVSENNEELEDVEVRVLRYNVETNTYITTETPLTNFEGEAVLHLQLNTEYYKFQLYYEGELKKTTDPTYITSTELSIQITIGEEGGEDFFIEQGITYTLNYTDSTENFNFEYADNSGTTTQGCLAVYTWTAKAETLVNSSCNAAASGVVLLNAPAANGTTYVAYAYVTYSGDNHYLATLTKGWTAFMDTGTLGVFLTFLLVIVSAIAATWRPDAAVIMASFAPLLASLTGIFKVPVVGCVPFIIAGLVVAVILRSRGGAS